MAELHVTLSTHNFAVRRITARGKAAVETFARRNVQYGMQRVPGNRYARLPLRVFAAATADRSEYRFHINQLKEFKEHLASHYLVGDAVDWVQSVPAEPRRALLTMKPEWVARGDQIPVVEYLVSDEEPISKFINLQTGVGKSFVSMKAASDEGYVLAIIVKPMYMDKWISDIRKTYDIETSDLMVVRGGAQLQALLALAMLGELEAKVVIISNKTIQNWLKLYEKFGGETLELGYDALPSQLFEVLGAGVRLIDEVHQDFHLNFKIDLYTNIRKSYSLSATLLADDPFLNKMYEVAYPLPGRYVGAAYHRYAAARAVIYKLRYPEKVRYKDPASKNYSHHVYEQYILRNQNLAANYLQLIGDVLHGTYLKDWVKGERFLVFCASIEMCTVVQSYLRNLLPHLDIQRYVEEDPFENLTIGDGCVSTLLSAGTAVDIDNLTTVVMTTCVSSSQSNVQGFGRLRKLKTTRVPMFLYFCCEDVDKQVSYHEKKRLLLEDRAITYGIDFINQLL